MPHHPLDSQDMYGSIELLAKQVQHAWSTAAHITVPKDYRSATSVVLFGMGGSALGMDIIQAVFFDTLKIPVTIVNGYDIPHHVDTDTLAIVSSYSGTTEEVITVAKQINAHTNKILAITTGGPLQELAEKNNWPMYIINPQYNPCEQPRIAVGYNVIGLLGLLRQAGVVDVSEQDIDDVVHYLDGNRTLLEDEASRVLEELAGKVPLFVASEFLSGNAHVVSNQINENGKNFATTFFLPELNHHLLEGLTFPKLNAQYLHFVCIESNLYHARNQKRYAITKQVLDKQNILHSTFIPTASTKLQQAFEVLQWGGFLSYFLAIRNEVDPSPIPWVDYFKDALK